MDGVDEFEFEVVCHGGSVREMIKIRNIGDAYNRSYLSKKPPMEMWLRVLLDGKLKPRGISAVRRCG